MTSQLFSPWVLCLHIPETICISLKTVRRVQLLSVRSFVHTDVMKFLNQANHLIRRVAHTEIQIQFGPDFVKQSWASKLALSF